MKLAELQKYIGQKIPGTNLTFLEDLGTKLSRGRYHRFIKVQCDCGIIREVESADFLRRRRTCGQIKICPYAKERLIQSAKQANLKGAKLGGAASAKSLKSIEARKKNIEKQRKNSILLENKKYNFILVKSAYQAYVVNASARKLEWYLTPEFIEQLWIEQDGKCKITGVPLTCGTSHKNHTWSLDRIDNNKPYTKDNVQIVSKTYNMVKATRTDEEMRLIAYLISQNIPYEELRIYNSMTLEQISNILKDVTKTSRK